MPPGCLRLSIAWHPALQCVRPRDVTLSDAMPRIDLCDVCVRVVCVIPAQWFDGVVWILVAVCMLSDWCVSQGLVFHCICAQLGF